MKYQNTLKAIFLERENRFIARCLVDGEEEVVHVKNTGRCKELLIKNREVILQPSDKATRKTKYDLISVYKNDYLVNIDSIAANEVFYEALMKKKIILNGYENISYLKKEYKYYNSRFDFYIENNEKKALIEVKSVTLEEEGVCRFPDAPTLRGIKHINELIKGKEEGFDAFIVFIIKLENVEYFTPNTRNERDFYNALLNAKNKGVNILAFNSLLGEDYVEVNEAVEVRF